MPEQNINLILPVTFNPDITNADEVCDALDQTLGHALSTDNLLEDLGNPCVHAVSLDPATVDGGGAKMVKDDGETQEFVISPPGTPIERIEGAAKAIQRALPDHGQFHNVEYADVRAIRGYAENILIQLEKLKS